MFIHAKQEAFDSCSVKSSVKLVTFQMRIVDWTIIFGFYSHHQWIGDKGSFVVIQKLSQGDLKMIDYKQLYLGLHYCQFCDVKIEIGQIFKLPQNKVQVQFKKNQSSELLLVLKFGEKKDECMYF